MEEYKIMLEHLLGAIMGHIENEVAHTFHKKDGDAFDIIEEAQKLEPREFAAFGCRITSLARVLENFEGYFKKNFPEALDKFNSIQATAKFYEQCIECQKKARKGSKGS
jgi:hypothetical protein